MAEMRELWSNEECTKCGVEGLASRSEPVPVSKPYVCEGCEMYDRGYADAEKHVTELKAQIDKAVGCLVCFPIADPVEVFENTLDILDPGWRGSDDPAQKPAQKPEIEQ